MTAISPSKETILVADDEASIRRILETRLSMIGYQVVTACDGNEALDLFRNCEPVRRDYVGDKNSRVS